MWLIIAFLWLIPIALGLAMLSRMARGKAALTQYEHQLLFGNGCEPKLSLLLGIKLALFSLLLFLAGAAQGLTLINLGLAWTVLVPLITAAGIIFILSRWLHKTSSEEEVPREGVERSSSTESHIADVDFKF
jgi:hypothetical protein